MSVESDQEPAGPHDPLHYAPRRLRERPEPRLTTVEETRALRDNKRLEAAVGRIATPAPLDSQLESAVYESLRRPLDPAILGEPRALARELERRGAMFGVAGRLAAAIGVSAIIALFFVIMMPASRQPDAGSSFSATVQSFTNALGQQPAPVTEETRKPALAEFQSLLGSDTAQAAEREQPDKQSDKTLQQFMQWRQKAGDTAP
jgi:Sec-independent protein translocase protein TatA